MVALFIMASKTHIRSITDNVSQLAENRHSDSEAHENTLILGEDDIAEDPYHPSDHQNDIAFDAQAHDSRPTQLILPLLASMAVAIWTAYFLWSKTPVWQAGPTPSTVSDLIIAWTIPVLLVATAYILFTRSSTREIGRYGDAANLLSQTSHELEGRLVTINRELSLAREFLSTQSRELDYVGRSASERLSDHATILHSLIAQNTDEVEKIATISEVAAGNMEKLRDDLPVIANSARDVSNQIGGAGRGAQAQVDTLIGGFERLNKFGLASERQVDALKHKVEDTLASFSESSEHLNILTASRFRELHLAIDLLRSELDDYEIEALGGIRQRAGKLNEELAILRSEATDHESISLTKLIARIEEIRTSSSDISHSIGAVENAATKGWNDRLDKLQTDIDALQDTFRIQGDDVETQLSERALRLTQISNDAANNLRERLGGFDADMSVSREAFSAGADDLRRHLDSIAEQFETASANIAELSNSGEIARRQIADDMTALSGNIEDNKALLQATSTDLETVTNDSVRLLELLQAGVLQSKNELPLSLSENARQISDMLASITALTASLGEAETTSHSLSATVDDSHEKAQAATEYLRNWQDGLSTSHDSQREQLAELHDGLSNISDSFDGFALRSNTELANVIAMARDAVDTALAGFDEADSERLQSLANNIGLASADAIERTIKTQTVAAVEQVEASAERAAQHSQNTLVVLHEQLAKVDELSAMLESRVNNIRETATDQKDGDFSRRVAAITENLHSSSIDISKAMSEDVSEIAWTAYLRGDRGIFTRRAVRLLDNTQSRDIAALYDNDGEFREHVSRYIQDFESLLRSLLATRDGNTLSVTILSSDMGKLYVALAQAIERLRN